MLGVKTVPTGGSSDTLTTPSGVYTKQHHFVLYYDISITCAHDRISRHVDCVPEGKLVHDFSQVVIQTGVDLDRQGHSEKREMVLAVFNELTM